MPVEIDDVFRWNGDARAFLIVGALAVGHDHVEAVDGAALEEAHESRAVGGGTGRYRAVTGKRSPGEEKWIEPETYERKTAGLNKDTSGNRHATSRPLPPVTAFDRPIVSGNPVRPELGREPWPAPGQEIG